MPAPGEPGYVDSNPSSDLLNPDSSNVSMNTNPPSNANATGVNPPPGGYSQHDPNRPAALASHIAAAAQNPPLGQQPLPLSQFTLNDLVAALQTLQNQAQATTPLPP
ncbi:hypothetical protein JCM11641_005215, partial [Rhodosporidiobolus odoratus]